MNSAVRFDHRKSEQLTDLTRLYLKLKHFKAENRVIDEPLKAQIMDVKTLRHAEDKCMLQAKVLLR